MHPEVFIYFFSCVKIGIYEYRNSFGSGIFSAGSFSSVNLYEL